MTDRIRYLTVQLDEDMRTDDVGIIVNAILAIRHVYSVRMGEPVGVPNLSDREVAQQALRDKLMAVLWPKPAKEPEA